LEREGTQLACKDPSSLLPALELSIKQAQSTENQRAKASSSQPCMQLACSIAPAENTSSVTEGGSTVFPSVQMLKIHRKHAVKCWKNYVHGLVVHMAWLNAHNPGCGQQDRPHKY